MTQDWSQWQGEVVDGEFRLDQYLCGTDHSGVFLTEYSGQKTVIKIRPGQPRSEPGVALSHPRLLRIFRVGRWGRENTPYSYLVMELADVVLSSVVPERALDPEEATETLTPVLEGLAYLHERGLTHSRVKPSNILSAGEQLKLSSDGLRRSGEASALTGERGAYDAPEIADGPVTPAADIWSLGIVLVEALTRQRPVCNRTGDPVVPATMPDPFREIASHCLQPDPQTRWTASQIAARLSGGAAENAPSAPKKRYGAAVAIGGLAGVAVVAGAVFLSSRPGKEVPVPQVVAPRAETPPPAPAPPPPEELPAPAAPPAPAKAARLRGRVEHEVKPDVSAKALATIQGQVKVRVRVGVDTAGKVVDTRLDTPRVSRYFAAAALQAARRWRFAPPAKNGDPVASSWVLEFDFGRSGAKMLAREQR